VISRRLSRSTVTAGTPACSTTRASLSQHQCLSALTWISHDNSLNCITLRCFCMPFWRLDGRFWAGIDSVSLPGLFQHPHSFVGFGAETRLNKAPPLRIMYDYVNVITGHAVSINGHSISLCPDSQPFPVCITFPRKLQKKSTIMTTVGEMISVAFHQISRGSWHVQTIALHDIR